MATVPVEMTFVAGAVLTAAQLNTNVRDAINFIIAPPLAVVRQTVAQSIPNSTFTPYTFDTEDIDRDGMHSTSSNTGRLTAQTAGWYSLQGSGTFVASGVSAGEVVGFQTNGTGDEFGSHFAVTNAGFPGQMTVAATSYLNVGDYVQLMGFQGTGGAINSSVGATGAPRFQALWVSS